MPTIHDEILAQPAALRAVVERYSGDGEVEFPALAADSRPVLTGMGASYHAAWIAALHLNALGIPAFALEAVDLLHYGLSTLNASGPLVYVSQSGESAEVAPIVDALPLNRLIAVTNNTASRLARHADTTLPLYAGDEATIAGKTYVNTVAILWLLARRWGNIRDGSERAQLEAVIRLAEAITASGEREAERLLDEFGTDTPLWLGHGPHAASARHAAMTVSEVAKVPAFSMGIGAFRHGFIESTHPESPVILFVTRGAEYESTITLARELDSSGAKVRLIEIGRVKRVKDVEASGKVDPFLAPILNVIPAQFYALALAKARGVQEGFRYISKVVRQL